jgi:26S proteasome regulatory subunit N2
MMMDVKIVAFSLRFSQVDSMPSQEKKEIPEPTSEVLSNPARVIPGQERFVRFLPDSRYKAFKGVPTGFVMLQNLMPDSPEEFVSNDTPVPGTEPAAAPATAAETTVVEESSGAADGAQMDEDEPSPPDAFEFQD